MSVNSDYGRVRAKPETRNISSSEMSEKIRRILERMAGAQRAESIETCDVACNDNIYYVKI